jgi:multidrug efflux system outer membrane protein
MNNIASRLIQSVIKFSLLLSALLLVACSTTGSNYKHPDLVLPLNWPAKPENGDQSAGNVNEQWWTLYADAKLNQIENEALLHNADIQVAAARILELRAQLGISEADHSPVVSANASQSHSMLTTVGATPLPASIPRNQNSTHISLNASYELDFWGKLHRASEASRADLLSAESASDTVRLSLTTQVAQQYFTLVSLDAQEGTIRTVLAGRQERLTLSRKQIAAGVLSEYDLHQANAEMSAIKSQLYTIDLTRKKQESLLTLLLGRSPREVIEGNLNLGTPNLITATVPEGLPAELLLHRPDLKDAEQRLIALNARMEATRAQFFPAITLTSYLGVESASLSNLFSGPAGIFQFAAGVSEPLFNAGRTGYLVDAAEARQNQALIQYKQAVASAFIDVRNALLSQDSARQVLAAETSRSESLAQSYKQATLRFEAGITSRLELLDVERNFLQAQLNRLDAERAQRSAVADLFKALGGGWQSSNKVASVIQPH